jgi:hypothetical protein
MCSQHPNEEKKIKAKKKKKKKVPLCISFPQAG